LTLLIFQFFENISTGTTHLLIGSSTTPNSVPSFLTSTLPQIARSLLALDISANFLGALPPVLAVCENLEELNVGSNPLRVLPVFLADLINLRVLIADSTGITTLPDTLVDLDKLHTISIRRNKLHALPSWLCLLPALQTLCVDGNPFQGPWRALVDPLLAKAPSTPVYPPSTPVIPLSASLQSSQSGHIPQVEADDEFSDQESSTPSPAAQLQYSADDDDQTMTIERSLLGRAKTSPTAFDHTAQPTSQTSAKPLARTRTTPNRNYYDQNRAKSTAGLPSESRGGHQSGTGKNDDTLGKSGGSEIRKMKSAGDLRRARPGAANGAAEINAMPQRPPLLPHAGSLSSSNLLNSMAGSNGSSINSPSQAESPYPKRFASLGPSSQLTQKPPVPLARPVTSGGRPQLSQSMWEQSGGVGENGQFLRSLSNGNPGRPRPPSMEPKTDPLRMEDLKVTQKQRSRWGFLKKMSMGKIKPDSPTVPSSGSPNPTRVSRPTTATGGSPPKLTSSVRGMDRLSKTPQIDLRFSTTGALDAFPAITASYSHPPSPISPFLVEKPPMPSSNGFLAAPAPVRSAKRRSFLPIDAPGQISLSIPENSKFVSGVVVSPDADDQQAQPRPNSVRGGLTLSTPVVDHEVLRRKEEERARDAYMRALRSVMAYLKDMNDLSHVQQSNSLSMYGVSSDEHPHPRSRRPTVVESQFSRESSSGGSTTDSSSHLRSAESIAGMRSGSSSQTLSVMTTDSSGSQEERKFKDDKGKRAMVIREIVV